MRLSRIVALAQVADVPRSIAFYERLGFVVGNTVDFEGRTTWAWLDCGAAALMVTEAEVPPSASVLLYLYGEDVAAMRAELVAAGVACGPIETPFYAPQGEFRVEDPDGYVLMFSHD